MGKLRIEQTELDFFDAVFVDQGVEILLKQLVDGLRQVVRGNAEVLRHILQGQVAVQVGLPIGEVIRELRQVAFCIFPRQAAVCVAFGLLGFLQIRSGIPIHLGHVIYKSFVGLAGKDGGLPDSKEGECKCEDRKPKK